MAFFAVLDRHDKLHGSVVVQSFNRAQSCRNAQLWVRDARIAELVHFLERTLEAVAKPQVKGFLGFLDRLERKEILRIRVLIRIEMANVVLAELD